MLIKEINLFKESAIGSRISVANNWNKRPRHESLFLLSISD